MMQCGFNSLNHYLCQYLSLSPKQEYTARMLWIWHEGLHIFPSHLCFIDHNLCTELDITPRFARTQA